MYRSNVRSSLKSILILIVFLTLIFPAAGSVLSQTSQTGPNPDVIKHQTIIKVYYFHTSYRCPSCIRIEKWSHQAVQMYFSEEIKSGKMIWEPISVDKPENKHFINEYQLYTKSVVLVEIKNNQPKNWVNLAKVWQLLRDREAFFNYINREVKHFMEKK